MKKDIYKIGEIAKKFGVSETTVYKWIKNGKLKTVKIDGVTRITESDLQNFIEDHRG